MGKWVTRAVIAATLIGLAGCGATFRNHGYVPPEEDLANIIVGVDTRLSVEDTLGVPTAQGVSNTDGMYFVASRWRHFGPAKPRPIERQIVAVTFDEDDVVQNVSRYGLQDGRVVVLERRVTDGGPSEISFIRQLMGNVGRVNTGDLIGGQP
ncbi:MAG: outer membrane protein assembly factor BamE [Pseudomonadota bacterium]